MLDLLYQAKKKFIRFSEPEYREEFMVAKT
jgi:hypothetical protein